MKSPKSFEVAFVGAGPAGIGPLVHAAGAGQLADFLERGIGVFEGSASFGAGSVGRYLINSNSRAGIFLECMRDDKAKHFPRAAGSEIASKIDGYGDEPAPLSEVAALVRLLAEDVQGAFDRSSASRIFLNHRVQQIHRRADSSYDLHVCSTEGHQIYNARQLVLGIGAAPLKSPKLHREVLSKSSVMGNSVLPMHSEDFLTRGGYERAKAALRQRPQAQALIVGGGDSAFSAAWRLLESDDLDLRPDSVVLAHRSPLKVTFQSVTEAQLAGYDQYTGHDVCSESGIVFRIGGVRYDAKELYLRVVAREERRVRFERVDDQVANWPIDWPNIALVIFATGYFPCELPFFEEDASPVPLLGSFGGKYVDGRSRLLLADGLPLPRAYAIGMCSGFVPIEGGFAGEPSFTGLANSIMLCHGPVGAGIFNSLLAESNASSSPGGR
jgi:hypothetical protein